jgi:hypothetical protein
MSASVSEGRPGPLMCGQEGSGWRARRFSLQDEGKEDKGVACP